MCREGEAMLRRVEEQQASQQERERQDRMMDSGIDTPSSMMDGMREPTSSMDGHTPGGSIGGFGLSISSPASPPGHRSSSPPGSTISFDQGVSVGQITAADAPSSSPSRTGGSGHDPELRSRTGRKVRMCGS